MSTPTPPQTERPLYQVGVFALVSHRESILLVRPHKLLLPGGPQSLPGLVLDNTNTGMGVVEVALRRLLRSEVGISVGDLRLVGSHILRAGSEQRPVPRLNLILSTEYGSGILNPQPDMFKSALWIPRAQLEGQVPEWLRAAIQEMLSGDHQEAQQSAGLIGGLFRRRNEKG